MNTVELPAHQAAAGNAIQIIDVSYGESGPAAALKGCIDVRLAGNRYITLVDKPVRQDNCIEVHIDGQPPET